MAWNASGTFSRISTSVSPATTGTTIDSADMNTYTADVTTGINSCLAKNGENAATGDLDIGGNLITNLGDGVADDDAATVGQTNRPQVFADNANGNPNVSDTALAVSTDIAAAWESVGQTGSSADNVWTALDSVPNTVSWIEVRIYSIATISSGTLAAAQTYVREFGSSEAAGSGNIVAAATVRDDTGNTTLSTSNVVTFKIAVDSSADDGWFDVYFQETSTGTGEAYIVAMTLVGYG